MSALFPVLPVAGWASKNKRVQKNMQSVPRESISTLPRHPEFAKTCKPFQKKKFKTFSGYDFFVRPEAGARLFCFLVVPKGCALRAQLF